MSSLASVKYNPCGFLLKQLQSYGEKSHSEPKTLGVKEKPLFLTTFTFLVAGRHTHVPILRVILVKTAIEMIRSTMFKKVFKSDRRAAYK